MAILRSSLLATALWSAAQATYLNSELSFGHSDKISPNLRGIPNWHILGTPETPQILSNKIVLTPPAPGNVRGAIWAEKPLLHSLWAADIDFRATGTERGGGNLQIWYVDDGQNKVGTASIYTVGKFDGLALVIDQYAGSGGYIRGFLNDGSTEYKSHHSVDSLAFGHCTYSYRNLGRASRIAVSQTADKFSVHVDGALCFESAKIKVPLHNYFGLSAATTENPDSFEIFKFVVTTENHTPDAEDQWHTIGKVKPPELIGNTGSAITNDAQAGDIPAFSDPPDAPATQFKSTDAQFADLHNRLQAMMKHVTVLNRDLQQQQLSQTRRHEELTSVISTLSSSVLSISKAVTSLTQSVESIQRKMVEMQGDVRQTKTDLHNSLDRHVAGITHEVISGHGKVLDHVESRMGFWGFLSIVLGSQGVLVALFVLYKKRKANSPKKYL